MKLLAVLFLSLPFLAQSIEIKGMAPAEIGEPVRVLVFEDYVTKKTKELAVSTVNADSMFTVVFDIDGPEEIIIEVGSVYGTLYLQPENDYSILVPKPSKGSRLTHNRVELIFETPPEKFDINYLIADFNAQLDSFVGATYSFIADPIWRKHLDTFKLNLADRYETTDRPFFINYMLYSIANLELVGHAQKDVGVNKEDVYLTYMHRAPVFGSNPAYMKLFNSFYRNVFGSMPPVYHRRILNAIILENRDSLMSVMGSSVYFSRPELAELAIIKGLGESYMKQMHPRSNILNLLQDIKTNSKFQFNQLVAGNMLGKITKLQKGYPAPHLEAVSFTGDTISLDRYKGQYLYLTFFEDWSTQSLAEMKIMVKLQERYGDKVQILSINLNESNKVLNGYLKDHKEFEWDFAWGLNKNRIMEYYDIRSYPQYFLIDPEGNLVQAPALSPNPKGNYDSIDRTMYNIKKSLEDKEKLSPTNNYIPPR